MPNIHVVVYLLVCSSAIKSTLNPLGLKVDFRALQRGLLSAIISMKIE